MALTKRAKLFASKVQQGKAYTLDQALDLLKTCSTASPISPNSSPNFRRGAEVFSLLQLPPTLSSIKG